MSVHAANKKNRAGKSPGRKTYDRDLVRDRTFDLLVLLLGTGKDQGARLVWDCPECGKAEKYAVKKVEGKGGCLVEGCRLSGYDDVFGMLAKLEGLDYHADFPAVLARSYELLGLESAAERRASPKGGRAEAPAQGGSAPKKNPDGKTPGSSRDPSARAVPVPPKGAATENGRATGRADEAPRRDLDEILALASRVYARLLELCPLESRDRSYLSERGLSHGTIKKGSFGTMTAPRARNVKAVLQREFGREQLLTAPGFSEDEEDGRLKWTLTGDYVLIPYHDAEGRVTTIEGRVVGEHKGPRKYVTLRRAGNHLYLFPGHRPEDLQAVCEGAMGAIVAAECGLTVGAIQGCERFRASPSPEMLDGDPGEPLLELKGVDFGGRVIPYIPDADDPPNPNVLKAAPKASRWISEPQNGKAAICLLPRGADLDEWLLSLEPGERGTRFAELLARANPPEDGADSATRTTASESADTKRTPRSAPDQLPKTAAAPPQRPEEAEPNEEAAKCGGEGITVEDHTRSAIDSPPSRVPASRQRKAKSGARPGTRERSSPGSQPELWADVGAPESGTDPGTAREGYKKSGVSKGARKLRDEVYRAMLEALSLKEEHLDALRRRGVMRAAASVGRFASADPESIKGAVSGLVERFGAKKLLSVPGFEVDATGKVRLSLAAGVAEEHVLLPCFDAGGLLTGVEGLAFDSESWEIEVEETVPLKGAGSHLYVFAHYDPGQIEGFCEGPLGAMLAAQEDVVIGAIGGFRRYKAASGPAEGRQPVDAVLPELEGVDFDGRQLAYAPRAGAELGEPNARYHEAASAARWLVERQGGGPMVVGFGGEENHADEPDDGTEGVEEGSLDRSGGPISLGEWILTLPEDEARDRLRELFPESPAREDAHEGSENRGGEGKEVGEAKPPPLSSKLVFGALALAAVAGTVLDLLILRLRDFAGYVGVGPGGEPLMYAGTLGALRRLADSAPFHVLYDLHWVAALACALLVTFAVVSKIRKIELARLMAARVRLGERWELHLAPGKALPSGAILTPGELFWAALAWPVAYLLSGWLISGAEALLSLATRLRVAPLLEDLLVSDPTLSSVYAATGFAVFVLWRRRSIRTAEARMLAGRIRH